jgi:hypothetical protein
VECRIQVVQRPGACTVTVAGRLNTAHVPHLCNACATASGRLRIDLTDLISADATGIDALRRLRREGAELVGVARYFRRWLA